MSSRARLRRLGFWAVVGALFVALGLVLTPGAVADEPPAATGSAAANWSGARGDAHGDVHAGAPATDAPSMRAAPRADDPACATPPPPKAKKPPDKPLWQRLIPIALLLVVIAVVVSRLPRVDLGHTAAFRRRRLLNWLPLGLTYSFLYMARYNLNQFLYIKAITSAEYGTIFGIGSAVYGLAFLINGPLTDKLGGRVTILISAAGSAVANVAIGYMVATGDSFGMDRVTALCVLYGVNMYFQSFGAVSIVKVNAAWFHLRERGTFGGIFGILISLGLFFAYDGGKLITDNLETEWLFYLPALLLLGFFALSWAFVRDTPSHTGHPDFDLGDASRDDAAPEPALAVLWRIVSHPVILSIALIELCSGFLRQAILQWSREFGKGVGLEHSFVFENWGVVSCIAGITGGMFAGAISDHLFNSRRLPVSAVLYVIMLFGAVLVVPMLDAGLAVIPWITAFSSMAVIGVHGMLSGTASADFGGRKNTGTAVGIIDGFVYAGSMIQSVVYGAQLPTATVTCADKSTRPNPAFSDIDNWRIWPYAMIPVAAIGLALAIRLWNARADRPQKPAS